MKRLVAYCAALAAVSLQAAVPKYVFVFIGDGMSTPQRMVAENFAAKTGHGDFAMNLLPYQANTRTRSADAVITDSAAAATAIACGVKTKNGSLGVDPEGNRVQSVAEVARDRGMKVGIMTTVGIVHATPAGFYAHRTKRGQLYRIGLDLVDSGFDYFAGGGVHGANDQADDSEYRGDLFDLARKAGYVVCTNRAEWAALRPGVKSWTLFSYWTMGYAIDGSTGNPTLAEIVEKGIEVLDNPKGFFMMCEGGEVDHAGHANDAATSLHEVLALDDAVKVALRFQERHPDETLVIVTGDHETGGLSMGFAGIGGHFNVEVLAQQKISTERFSNDIKALIRERKGEVTFEEVKPLVTEKFGLRFDRTKKDPLLVTPDEERKLSAAFAQDIENVRKKLRDTTAHDVARRYAFAQAVKNVLNAHAGVGWGSGAHTALPTLTTAKGAGAEILVGMTENTDIANRLKALLK